MTSVKAINPGIIYCPDQGLRRRQPVRERPRVRHDRAGRRRRDEHHRRARWAARQARPHDRRHRHRHADGVDDRQRPLRAGAHRQGPAAAGGDAGFDHALQPRLFCDDDAHRQGGARRAQAERRQQPARRHLSVQARRPQRLRLPDHEPRQPRALAAAAQAGRPRGPDRRPALRHRRRPRRQSRASSTRSSANGPCSTTSTRRWTS